MRLAGCFLLLSVIAIVAPVGLAGAVDLPPSPVLLGLFPDRGDIGHEISFRGSGFDPPEAIETRVYFGPSLTAAPSQLTDEEIDVVIPAGAETGWVWVGVTVSDGVGGEVELTSNPLKLLVIQQEIDLSDVVDTVVPPDDILIGGDEEGMYLVLAEYGSVKTSVAEDETLPRVTNGPNIQSRRRAKAGALTPALSSAPINTENNLGIGHSEIWYLKHDGTRELMRDFGDENYATGIARDPVSGTITGIESHTGFSRLKNLITNQTILTWDTVFQTESWRANLVCFDQSGNLIIKAELSRGIDEDNLQVNVWRFTPAEWTDFGNPPQLDPSNGNALLPEGTTIGLFEGSNAWWLADIAVSGDGTIYFSESHGNAPSNIWRIPARNGRAYEIIQMPEGTPDFGSGVWMLAPNPCGSGVFALNPDLHDDYDIWDPIPLDIYSVDDMRVVAVVEDVWFHGFHSGPLGNIFLFVSDPAGPFGLRWITPAEFEDRAPNFYQNFECSTDYDCGECDPEGGSPNDCVGAPVRLSNGNMRYTERDLLPTALPLLAVRTYDSAEALRNDSAGVFGRGWHSAFDASLTADASGTTIDIRTETNRQVEFVRIDGVYVQTRPSGSRSLGKLSFDGFIYRYRPAGDSLVRLFSSTSGALSGFEDIETGRSWAVDYADGLPVTISDSWSDGQWDIGGESGRITSILASGLTLSYVYGADGQLQSVSADGSLFWRAYEYQGFALTEVRDSDRIIEMHSYEQAFPYWATSSRTAAEDIVNVEYDVQSGTLRSIEPNKGETVTRVTDFSGYSTEYFTRPVGGRRRTVEVRGDCGCGTGDFAAYVYDGLGHVVREQHANGYITLRSWDHNGHLRSVGSGYVPGGCDPSAENCWLSLGKLAEIDLDGADATTVTFSYLDPNWPDKATDICRSSVVEIGAQTCTTLAFDATTGQVVRRVHQGWTWDGETGAVEEKTRISERHLYEPAEIAAFDPVAEASGLGIGITFEGSWAALHQPEGKLKETLGPRHFDLDDLEDDQTFFVYYPVDQLVPSDLRGRLAAQMDPLGNVTFFDDYDEWGNLTRTIDSRGVTTAFEFDNLGRLQSQTLRGDPGCDRQIDPLCDQDLVTEYFYDGSSNRRQLVLQADGSALRYSYDKWGRFKQEMRGVSEPEEYFERQRFGLDPHTGSKTKVELQSKTGGRWETKKTTEYTYDSQGRLTTTINPDGSYSESTYDAGSNLVTFKDAAHEKPNVTYGYDPHRRLTEVRQLIDPTLGWATTDYGYDDHGNLINVTDANDLVTTYRVDDFGATCRIVSPATGETLMDHNSAGQMVWRRDSVDATEDRTYDAGGNLTEIVYTKDTDTETRTFTYEDGRRATATTDTTTEAWTHDRRGLTVGYERDGIPLKMAYDEVGALTFYGREFGVEGVEYQLDWAGRPTSTVFNHPDLTVPISIADSAQYMPYGPMRTAEFSNSASENRLLTEHVYDLSYRRIGSQTTWFDEGVGVTLFDRYSYYDSNGNLITIKDDVDSRDWTYKYDDAARLIQAERSLSEFALITYDLDAVGNRTERQRHSKGIGAFVEEYSYDPPSGLLSTVTETPSGQPPEVHPIDHDDAGNLLDDDLSTYGYNPSGTLAWQGLDAGLPLVGFDYDSGGRRVATLTDPGGAAEERREHFLLPDGRPWFTEEPSGARTWYIYLGSQLVSTVSDQGGGSPETHFIIGNHLGYPEMVIDDTGNTLWTSNHLPFGETVDESGSAFDPLLRYPGQWVVPESEALGLSEMFYNGYRWYNPGWGRYTQSDPVGLRGGINLYRYANANPIFYTDSRGLQATEWNRDPFVPPWGSGPWGSRPDGKCCDQGELTSRIAWTEDLLAGREVLVSGIGGFVARSWSPVDGDPDGKWFEPHPPNTPFDPGCNQSDKCLQHCCRVHEWYHYTDMNLMNMEWDDAKMHGMFEVPAYRVELHCMFSFLAEGGK